VKKAGPGGPNTKPKGGSIMRTWDLFREMEQFQRDMDDIFRGTGLNRLFAPTAHGSGSFPRINLREDEDHLFVEALLPGVDPRQVEINMLGNTLTLSGEREIDDPGENGRIWHRRERFRGKFMRTFELPAEIDADKVKAEAKHGLLRVTLPKAETEKPRSIQVDVR